MVHHPFLRPAALALLALAAAGAQAEKIYGITDPSFTTASLPVSLVSFDSASASSINVVAPITGLVSGHTLRAIDFRPSNGMLYAISTVTGATTGQGQLYTVNLATGALTTVGSTFALGTTSTRVSMDFNPVVDRVRVVTGNNLNLRLNPNDGTVAGTDTNLAYAAGDANSGTPLVSDVAYSNNVAGATSTTLYAYEYINDAIVTVGTLNGAQSPNTGLLHTVGGVSPLSAVGANMGFDISGASGVAYLTMDESATATDATEIYTVNLATGALTQIASEVGVTASRPNGITILDISAQPVPEPATMVALGAGALALARRRRKA